MNHRKPPILIAVGGGKGGTGKSLIAVQLGVLLARQGVRVVLIDADPQGANLHTFFGLEDPDRALDEVLSQQYLSQDAVLPTGFSQLQLLPGLRDGLSSSVPVTEMQSLLKQWRSIEADVMLCDVGSGLQDWSTYFFAHSDVGLVVTMPEAIAIEKEYRFLRGVCRWPMREELPAQEQPPSHWLPAPWLARLQQTQPERAEHLRRRLQRQMFCFMMNGVRAPEEKELVGEMVAVCQRLLGIRSEALGWLEFDDRLWLSILHRRPMVLEFPESRWTLQLQEILPVLLHLIQKGHY